MSEPAKSLAEAVQAVERKLKNHKSPVANELYLEFLHSDEYTDLIRWICKDRAELLKWKAEAERLTR